MVSCQLIVREIWFRGNKGASAEGATDVDLRLDFDERFRGKNGAGVFAWEIFLA